MKEIVMVLRAADMAARIHAQQRRKGAAREPYVNHLLEVAYLVAEATGGADAEAVVAALLHDAIEDQQVPRDLIAREFGERVASLVCEVTDDKTLPKAQRKAKQVETASHKSGAAKIIKLADKSSNVQALGVSPPADWPTERRLAYVTWARDVVNGLRGGSAWLEREFDRRASEAERKLAG